MGSVDQISNELWFVIYSSSLVQPFWNTKLWRPAHVNPFSWATSAQSLKMVQYNGLNHYWLGDSALSLSLSLSPHEFTLVFGFIIVHVEFSWLRFYSPPLFSALGCFRLKPRQVYNILANLLHHLLFQHPFLTLLIQPFPLLWLLCLLILLKKLKILIRI